MKGLKEDVINFMNFEDTEVDISVDLSSHLFGNLSQTARAKFFGIINCALREYCINKSKQILIMRQYGFLPSLISFWWNFENRLYDFAFQTAQIFEERAPREGTDQPQKYLNQTYFQIVRFGYNNWAEYVLKQKLINDELLSAFTLIMVNPHTYPFQDISFVSKIKSLFAKVELKTAAKIKAKANENGKDKSKGKAAEKDKVESEDEDVLLLRYISTYFKLFLKHKIMYKKECEEALKECSYIADMLPLYSKIDPESYDEGKSRIKYLLNKWGEYIVSRSECNEELSNSADSVFQSYEYIELMRMIFRCSPEIYMKEQIPKQVDIIYNICQKAGKTTDIPPDSLLSYYTNKILPIYKKCEGIVMESYEARKCFAEEFRSRLFPMKVLEIAQELFDYGDWDVLHCVWTMCRLISDYVIIISNAFIEHYKYSIQNFVKTKDERLQSIISEINNLVEKEFEKDEIILIARSTLYIPYQNDSQLVARARLLVEQAHEPLKMKVSIRELFDIVPYIKSKKDLFTDIGEFLQNQLLSQISPNVELERSLIDSMGQYAEIDLIDPLKKIVIEFANRYKFFDKVKEKIGAPPNVKISILSNQLWKDILKRQPIPALAEFDRIKRAFRAEFKLQNKNMDLVFCDPASVVEVKAKLVDSKQRELCLFNGVQFAIVKSFESQARVKHGTLVFNAKVDDADEQIEALVKAGLLIKIKGTDEYTIIRKFPSNLYRNFAKSYTSAENIALRQLREQDIEHSISCKIVRLLKQNRSGMTADDIVKDVIDSTKRFFIVKQEKIREQIRDLEIKKFIKNDFKTKRFVYAE